VGGRGARGRDEASPDEPTWWGAECDPFDRLLIAQSIEEGWPIITADPLFERYPVEVIW